ncbi:MAG TPA: DUF433 domain-containing protein [Noviherbaspirillum sp.]|nr:DUF433 domain-containing protein [Noviherbaspirillum sp.]
MEDDPKTYPRCAFPPPPLRPELQAAYDEMDAKGEYFAYAVCRTWDDRAWEVNTKEGYFYTALSGSFPDHDEAIAAGAAWLRHQLERAANEKSESTDGRIDTTEKSMEDGPKNGAPLFPSTVPVSRTPCHAGDRLPVTVLFENLAAGLALDEIVGATPSLTKEAALRALQQAKTLLEAAAQPEQQRMRKIVLNQCVGSFSLSEQAWRILADKKHWHLEIDPYFLESGHIPHVRFKPIENPAAGWETFNASWQWQRDDPDLVWTVETLGSGAASGAHSKLGVIAIPADVEWLLVRPDSGFEWVADRHRVWGMDE